MVRLFGVVIKDDQKIDYALTSIYGVGWSTSRKIVAQSGIDSSQRIGKLDESELKKITQLIEKNAQVEGSLREQLNENLKRLREIRCYRGMRHAFGLPSRGQRTRSNARTKRGKRKTVGALRKEAWAKLEQQKK